MAPGPFREEYLLGTGGMAEVWRASGPSGPVAVKRLLPHSARNPSVVAAFEREGRLLQRIQHPNVIGIHQVLRDERGTSLVLEYVEGTDLRALAGAPAPGRVALRIIRDLLCALEAVHTLRDAAGMPLGLIHRDLSPSNVLVSIEGSVKLADFGIARAASGSHATTGVNMKGTVAYLSPEQAMGASVDARADLFAVGAVLYEMLSGAPIYDEEDPRLILARARAGDVQSLSVAKPDAPFAIVELVDRALSATPADRFPSAAVMRAEVERVADRTCGLAPNEELSRWVRGLVAATPTPEFVTTRDENLSTGHRRIVVLAALATCLLSLAGYWLFRRSAPASTTRFDATNAVSTPTVPPGLSEPRPRADDLPTATVPESHPLPSSEALKAEGRPEGRVTTLRRPPTVAAAASAARGTENGFLDIGSEPGFAYVAIDGVKVGATPLFGREITPGTHRIEVSREGLGEKSFTIDVHPGDRIRRVIKLP